jgi:hypothetical protein
MRLTGATSPPCGETQGDCKKAGAEGAKGADRGVSPVEAVAVDQDEGRPGSGHVGAVRQRASVNWWGRSRFPVS